MRPDRLPAHQEMQQRDEQRIPSLADADSETPFFSNTQLPQHFDTNLQRQQTAHLQQQHQHQQHQVPSISTKFSLAGLHQLTQSRHHQHQYQYQQHQQQQHLPSATNAMEFEFPSIAELLKQQNDRDQQQATNGFLGTYSSTIGFPGQLSSAFDACREPLVINPDLQIQGDIKDDLESPDGDCKRFSCRYPGCGRSFSRRYNLYLSSFGRDCS